MGNDTSLDRTYQQLPNTVSGFDIAGNAFIPQPVQISPSWPGMQVLTVTGSVDRISVQPMLGQPVVIDALTATKPVTIQGSRADTVAVGPSAQVPSGTFGLLLSNRAGWFFVPTSGNAPAHGDTVDIADYGVGNGIANDAPALTAAYTALPAAGGDIIISRGTWLMGQTNVPQTVTFAGKPVRLLIQPGAELVWPTNAAYPTPAYGLILNATNCQFLFSDKRSSKLTAGFGVTLLRMIGVWPGSSGTPPVLDGTPYVAFMGGCISAPNNGGGAVLLDTSNTTLLPNDPNYLQFEGGLLLVDDCHISGFDDAFVVGQSCYYSIFSKIVFTDNGRSIYFGLASNADCTQCVFNNAGNASMTVLGPDVRAFDNHFFGLEGSVAPDLLLLPGAVSGIQGGYNMVRHNTFHPERETFRPARRRVLVYNAAFPQSISLGVEIEGGNHFLTKGQLGIISISRDAGGLVTVTCDSSANAIGIPFLLLGETCTVGILDVADGSKPGAGFCGTVLATGTANPYVFTYVQGAANAGTGIGGACVGLGAAPIGVQNPIGRWSVRGNLFENYATLIDDAQPRSTDVLDLEGASVFQSNRVKMAGGAFGVRGFTNGGVGFSVVESATPSADVGYGQDPRETQPMAPTAVPNAVTAPELFGTGLWTLAGCTATDGQLDPWDPVNGTRAAKIVNTSGSAGAKLSIAVTMPATDAFLSLYLQADAANPTGLTAIQVAVVDTTTNEIVSMRALPLGANYKRSHLPLHAMNVGHTYRIDVYAGNSQFGVLNGSFFMSGVALRAQDVAYEATPPNLRFANVVMPADANYTATVNERGVGVMYITSGVALGATRDVVMPLISGLVVVVVNLTTGAQSVRLIGSSGTGATVANGATKVCTCNGTNWYTT